MISCKMYLTELTSKILSGALAFVARHWPSYLLLVVVVLATWLYYSNPARHSPPGPTYIPFIGSIPCLFGPKFSGKFMMELSRKYRSPIVSMRVCGQLMTTINDYDLIKDAFEKRRDMVDRNAIFTKLMDQFEKYEGTTGGKRKTEGILFGSGREWKFQRRFTLQLMQDFGKWQHSSEERLTSEASEAIEAFKEHRGHPFDPRHIITMAAANIINRFIYGRRFTYTDKNFLTSLNSVEEFTGMLGSPISFHFLHLLGRILFKSKYQLMHNTYTEMYVQVRREIDEHIARFNGSVNDVIDAYLVEMAKKEDDGFNPNTIVNLIRDLFLAGINAASSTLLWALLEMAVNQEVQNKVYNELKRVLVSDKNLSMNTIKDTPYTEAVLSEIQRFHTTAELGSPHANTWHDVKISGYIIPKNTMICANLYAIHHDPKLWKKPDEFYPENFLDDHGKVINLEKLNPFSIGRRSCAGETLARTELYIFFATWMRNVRVKLKTDATVPDMRSRGNFFKQPKPFSIRVYPRV